MASPSNTLPVGAHTIVDELRFQLEAWRELQREIDALSAMVDAATEPGHAPTAQAPQDDAMREA